MKTFLVAALCAAWSAGCAFGNPVVLIDNLDASEVSTVGMVQGTNSRCLSDAHAGGFIESGTNLGNSNVTFSFNPPVDGCYQVEEYHPGSNGACSLSLSTRVAVDIEYCRGGNARAVLDQSVAGGDWTSLGRFPFYAGHQGRITLSSADGDRAQCNDGSCIFVADAVRFRWLAPACEENLVSVLMDNLDRSEVSAVGMGQGTNPHCLSDAHAGGFFEGSTDLHNASATFTFNPHVDGCYQVQEYHPGRNALCSHSLAKNVAVDIDYCAGQQARAFVDQSVGGGQWTTLGRFPFYRGQQGRITLSSAAASDRAQCDAPLVDGTCIFVADAVRVQWYGDTCDETRAPVPLEGPSLLVFGLALAGASVGAGLVGVALCMRQRSLGRKCDAKEEAPAIATAVTVLEESKDAKGTPLPADVDAHKKETPVSADCETASVSTDTPTSDGGDSQSYCSLHVPEDEQSCSGI